MASDSNKYSEYLVIIQAIFHTLYIGYDYYTKCANKLVCKSPPWYLDINMIYRVVRDSVDVNSQDEM